MSGEGSTEHDVRPGHDAPDSRGRTGLHRTGRSVSGNPAVRVTDVEVVSDGWHARWS